MLDSQFQYLISWHEHIREIDRQDWDRLALPLETPFLEWSWLNNLEVSGSAIPEVGWLPNHLAVWKVDPQDRSKGRMLVAAAPLYLKSHSYGEFVFDQEWADVSRQVGINYYPKLLGMTPFTPAEGYRFLIDPQVNEKLITDLMLRAIDEFCETNQIYGCHFLFVDPEWRSQIESHGFSAWLHHSYIWRNQGYETFDCYLADFNANQRRNIKRERNSLAKRSMHLEVFAGADIPTDYFDQMHQFYDDTCSKFMWGSKYLTRQFFLNLESSFAGRVVMMAAFQKESADDPIGMSFCLRKGPKFYGRYWGSSDEFDCLHFNACYYKPIEWAIAQGIQQFDPGAGGRHKKRRGFPATPNYSLHRFYHPRMRQIFEHYVPQINGMEQEQIDSINQDLPFKIAP
jgi:uncharacterized protein